MLAILAILFGLAAAFCPEGISVPTRRRLQFGIDGCVGEGKGKGGQGFIGGYDPFVRKEEGDAEDKEDMKKGKMYKKFSEMSKKKLMLMIKKYEKKIAIMKKVLKGKKKEKKN